MRPNALQQFVALLCHRHLHPLTSDKFFIAKLTENLRHALRRDPDPSSELSLSARRASIDLGQQYFRCRQVPTARRPNKVVCFIRNKTDGEGVGRWPLPANLLEGDCECRAL